MNKELNKALQGLTHLISPRVCRVCGQTLTSDERVMCLSCNMQLPRTYVHRSDFNDIHRRLGHNSVVDRAAGWFYYKSHSEYAHLLVESKYGDSPEIDYELGRMCASELSADGFFDGIDVIVPMPMYWLKRLLRGYNQAERVARGIASVTGLRVDNAIVAYRSHGVQARNNRQQRHQRIAGTMRMGRRSDITGRHVLLVDDIITSGASCIEAIRALRQGSPASISVLSLGLTMHNS